MRRFTHYRRQVAETSPQAVAQELDTVVANILDGLHGNLALPALGSQGELLQGSNLMVVLRRIRFQNADEDVPLSHGLGKYPRHWMVCNPSDYARFRSGAQSPDTKVLYLRCDTAGVEADFLVWADAGGTRR